MIAVAARIREFFSLAGIITSFICMQEKTGKAICG